MVWPVLVAVAGSTVTRYVIGGAVTYVVGTEVIGSFWEGADEEIEGFEKALKESGADVVQGFAEGTMQILEYGGVAVKKGVDLTYNEIRKSVLEDTANTFTKITIGAIVILSAVKLFSMARNA